MVRWSGLRRRNHETAPPNPFVFLLHSLPLTVAIVTVSLTVLSNMLTPHSAETSKEVIQQRAQAAEKPEGSPQSSTRWMRLA